MAAGSSWRVAGSESSQTEVLPVAFVPGAPGSVWGSQSLGAPRGVWAAASHWRPQADTHVPSSPVPPAQPSSVTRKLQTHSPVLVFDREASTPGIGQSGGQHSVTLRASEKARLAGWHWACLGPCGTCPAVPFLQRLGHGSLPRPACHMVIPALPGTPVRYSPFDLG